MVRASGPFERDPESLQSMRRYREQPKGVLGRHTPGALPFCERGPKFYAASDPWTTADAPETVQGQAA